MAKIRLTVTYGLSNNGEKYLTDYIQENLEKKQREILITINK